MIRNVCGPPMSKTIICCSSRNSTSSVPYGVTNCRAPPEGLQRVWGSSWFCRRSASTAFAHGWNGVLSLLRLPQHDPQVPLFARDRSHDRLAVRPARRRLGRRSWRSRPRRLRRALWHADLNPRPNRLALCVLLRAPAVPPVVPPPAPPQMREPSAVRRPPALHTR